MGTNVESGSATAAVVTTGAEHVFRRHGPRHHRPPAGADQLRPGRQRFTWLMIRFMVVMVPLVFLINGLTKHDWLRRLLLRAGRGRRA